MRGTGRRARLTAAAVATAALGCCVSLAACGGSGSGAASVTDRDFDRGNFSDPTRIDNRWLPLAPGSEFVMEGRANRGGGRLRHRIVFTVTDLTKVIDGVRTRVLWDRDYNAGRLEEGELTFHAQDDDGNVWNFGEYPEEYKNGKFAGAPDTWIAGLARARAGIVMRGEPKAGTPTYLQGWAPAIDFADRARIYRTGQRTCVPISCYTDVLVTEEWSPDDPAGRQLKYFAPGVGNIRVGASRSDKEQETLVLTKVRRLGAKELAAVRAHALELERRAYVARKDLYGRTPHAN